MIPQIASFLLNEDRKLSSSSESSSENSIVTYTLTKATLKQNEGARLIIMEDNLEEYYEDRFVV